MIICHIIKKYCVKRGDTCFTITFIRTEKILISLCYPKVLIDRYKVLTCHRGLEAAF